MNISLHTNYKQVKRTSQTPINIGVFLMFTIEWGQIKMLRNELDLSKLLQAQSAT